MAEDGGARATLASGAIGVSSTTLGREEEEAKHTSFLDGFKPQMDRLHRAFLGSIKREKALIQKCRTLKDRLATYAQGLEVAKRMKELDDRTIAGEFACFNACKDPGVSMNDRRVRCVRLLLPRSLALLCSDSLCSALARRVSLCPSVVPRLAEAA